MYLKFLIIAVFSGIHMTSAAITTNRDVTQLTFEPLGLKVGVTACSNELVFAHGFENGELAIPSYFEDFTLDDGAMWPEPWVVSGNTNVIDIQSGEARLSPNPTNYSLARVFAAVETGDVELKFAFRMEDATTQGVGFYVRQNGGYLDQTMTAGEGYGVFVEGSFRGLQGIGVWREVAGSEEQIAHSIPLMLESGVSYQVRFRVHQLNANSTQLQAKFWEVGSVEPAQWQVSGQDSTPSIQNVTGGIAVDSWSSITAGPISSHTFVDTIEVESLCNPLRDLQILELVDDSFQFTEGPLWRGDHLLFSDIDGNTIYRLDPPSTISLFRNPSNRSNGLRLDNSGLLLAAEHQTRQVSQTLGNGDVITLVDQYQGLAFNSPNDIDVAIDGSVYFSDPSYGLADPNDRELSFNGVFRRRADTSIVAEWMGVVGVNEPNGVLLSADQSLLFVTDTAAGRLLRFDVASGGDPGALSNMQVLRDNITIPDGMCRGPEGAIYVATWSPSIEVFSEDGAYWGSIPVPLAATNCTFGDADGKTLYITAQQALYRIRLRP